MTMTEQHSTPETDRVPAGRKIAWSCGTFTDTFMANSLNYLTMNIYNVGLGVDPRFLGWAMGVPRIWDAITDPFMGNITDNTRSRFGRRKPYVFLGAILCGLIFALIWMPPLSLSTRGIGIYFLIMAFIYYTVYTIFVVPWGAMGLEMSLDYHERTRIMAYRTFIAAVFGTLLGTLWWLAFKLGDGDDIRGIRYVGMIFGFLMAGFGIIPTLFVREKPSVQSQQKISFLKAFSATFSNKIFLLLGIITFSLMLGLFLANPLALYINIYHVYGGDKEAVSLLNMIAGIVFQITGLLLTPAAAWYGIKVGKKKALLSGLALVVIGYCTSWFFFTPKYPYLQLATFAICAPGLSCIWVFTNSMLADICDLDELKTGLRREGMYGAAYAWFCKASTAATMIVSGYIIKWSGYMENLDMQADATILKMRILYAAVPIFFISLAFVLTLFYSLTEEKTHEIRQIINQRKNQNHASSLNTATGESKPE